MIFDEEKDRQIKEKMEEMASEASTERRSSEHGGASYFADEHDRGTVEKKQKFATQSESKGKDVSIQSESGGKAVNIQSESVVKDVSVKSMSLFSTDSSKRESAETGKSYSRQSSDVLRQSESLFSTDSSKRESTEGNKRDSGGRVEYQRQTSDVTRQSESLFSSDSSKRESLVSVKRDSEPSRRVSTSRSSASLAQSASLYSTSDSPDGHDMTLHVGKADEAVFSKPYPPPPLDKPQTPKPVQDTTTDRNLMEPGELSALNKDSSVSKPKSSRKGRKKKGKQDQDIQIEMQVTAQKDIPMQARQRSQVDLIEPVQRLQVDLVEPVQRSQVDLIEPVQKSHVDQVEPGSSGRRGRKLGTCTPASGKKTGKGRSLIYT